MTRKNCDWIRKSAPLQSGAVWKIALAVTLVAQVSVMAQEQRIVVTAPEPAYQTVLRDAAKAVDREERAKHVDRLMKLLERDRSQLISQLLWYAAQNESDQASRSVVGQVLKRFDVSKYVIVTALAPHLDNRDDAICRAAGDLLRSYEDRSAERQPDFSSYRAIIAADVQTGRQPQASLVRMMYASHPGSALITMMRAYQLRDPDKIKSIRWTEHVVDDLLWKRRYGFVDGKLVDPVAVHELERLSRDEHWWARLYVAKIVVQHSELVGPGLVARLAADENLLVRESMQPPKEQNAPR